MARATFVKAARKDYPDHGIKKGESYYHWAFMVGGRGGAKRFSKTPPKRSQLTQSDFLGQVFDIEDDELSGEALSGSSLEDLEALKDDLASRIRDIGQEQQDKLDNMPDGLQQGPTGEMLQGRVDSCEEWAGEIEGIETDIAREEGETDEAWEERLDDVRQAFSECCYQGE